MMKTNNAATKPVHPLTLGKRALLGASIGLVLISTLLISVREPDPLWGKFWMLRPLIIVPLAGAMGGIFYYLMDRFRAKSGWFKIFAYLVSLIGYIVILWLGTIVGLDGTLWD